MSEQDIIGKLSELGYRLTPQRLMILSAIENSDQHISTEEIFSQVRARYPHVNISTVYRNLELLKNLSLVTETNMGGGRVRYHSSDKGHHHHLICQECGIVIELDKAVLSPLRNRLRRDYQFEADLKHLAILGRCQRCSK